MRRRLTALLLALGLARIAYATFWFVMAAFWLYLRGPTWKVALNVAVGLLCAWPLIERWRMFQRTERITQGLCANCGYDLRATSDRCPECGAMPTKGAAA